MPVKNNRANWAKIIKMKYLTNFIFFDSGGVIASSTCKSFRELSAENKSEPHFLQESSEMKQMNPHESHILRVFLVNLKYFLFVPQNFQF
jgi:hypothetical protein